MRIALINTTKENGIYPLGLLKIGAWQKSIGNECELFNRKLPDAGEFDEIWISTLFTFDIDFQLSIIREAINRAKIVRCGGISASLMPNEFKRLGADVHIGLLPDAEKFSPDYSLLKINPEYSITHTSRGCTRKCGFCMVKILEPKYKIRKNWENDIHLETKKVLFFDNNWLAKDKKELFKDIEKIKKLHCEGKINKIDFNQGLDCRLMTKEIAKELNGVPFELIRFAFDGMHEDGHFQKAIDLIVKHTKIKDFTNYVLYNFKDTPEDLYYRLKEHARLAELYGIDVKAFPMRYQPIIGFDRKRSYVGEHWTEKQKKGFMIMVGAFFTSGLINTRTIKEFEYIFTDSPENFSKLLNWNKLSEYCEKKSGKKRLDIYYKKKVNNRNTAEKLKYVLPKPLKSFKESNE